MRERWPVSKDTKTQNQVATILLLRELRRLERGEMSEPERRKANQ